MKKKTDKVKILSHTEIWEVLKKQQEVVGIVDEYIQRTSLPMKNTLESTFHANFVMQHIFVNIRNSYQDGIVLSQGLINNSPYYISTALYHANRTAQEFLIDLAYIMSDYKHKSGHEYLRYLKFIIDKEIEVSKELGENTFTNNQYKAMFPPHLNLKPKFPTQWTDTTRKEKIEQGLKLYKIEPPHFADFRSELHSYLSSTAHGNENTIFTYMQTPEKNLPKLEADLTVSIAHLEVVLESALNCYIKFYLARHNDCREIIKSMYFNKEDQCGK